ncbi:TIGR02206 family membrane protein [Luteolibacter flavescens]|uniref:TIGR02206 family membrane protein n=1 Tax=Luteolibacter flavescens TaxID=1859460 RepID=A0ABT3FJQ1_9BACT|nr:TIGR02206 family membrane protein [Luteolibacter flavescens]MCW1883240.1 TIGR02206 family membrane protein [Luteolibacter flavescens]
MPPVFHPFTAMHGWAMVIGFTGIAMLVIWGKKAGKNERIPRSILAFLCLAAFGYTQAAWMSDVRTPDLDSTLPLHLCDLAAFVAGFALLTGKRLLCVLTYFWGLAATIQALLTPAITVGFPHPAFVAFFVHHFAIVGAALYLPIVRGWRSGRPWWRGPLTALLWANVYLILSMAVNAWLGTNFGFTARKPVNPSLLDHMGDWPYYLIGMQALAVVLFSLLALPVLGKKNAESPAIGPEKA